NQSTELVNRSIYGVGGSLDVVWHPDYTLITCVTTTAEFRNALYVICQAIKFAEFEPATLSVARKDAAADAAREIADPFRAGYAALRSSMYHQSAYRLPIGG